MKQYDRSVNTAVNEWRNALQICQLHQLLPLLYVANEVLQTSKRNRGNKFLEAMSPVLGQALQHICSRDPSVTEKVRRTAKIWGDRRVFSIRFVNDLLQRLEPYRHGRPPPSNDFTNDGATFSPEPEAPSDPKSAPDGHENDNHGDDDDIRNILEDHDPLSGDEDADEGGDDGNDDADDDDDDIFGSNESPKLEIQVNMDVATDEQPQGNVKLRAKRRRSSMGSSAGTSSAKRRTSSSILSAASLLELWTRLSELQQRYDRSQHTLQIIDERLAKIPAESLEHLVGDELQQAFRQNEKDFVQMAAERKNLYDIAVERKALEDQAKKYVPWLHKALKQDQEDITFCDMLEQKISSFKDIHKAMVVARDNRREEERQRQLQQEAIEQKRREQEEEERFRRAALSKETEAKPGMVWNPSTREYQALDTNESWRE